MKMEENNRISHKQLYFQILLTFTSPLLLGLFGKGRPAGLWGILGTAAAVILLFLYLVFLIRLAPFCTNLKKYAGTGGGIVIALFLSVYVILTCGYLLHMLAVIVPESLTNQISGKWIAFLAVLVCAMGTHKGMQRRGRMAGASGGLYLAAVILLMVLTAFQGRKDYLVQMIEDSVAAGLEFKDGFYIQLCAFSGIGLLPFALPCVEKQGSSGKVLACGILTLGGILVGMELLLPAVFGWNRVLQEEYPVLPLLAGANLPGNVLARFDVIWMGILVFGLLFSIGSLLHYGDQILKNARLGTGRYWLAGAAYAVSLTKVKGLGIGQIFEPYLEYVFLPGLLLLQIFLMVRNRGKWKKKGLAAAGMVLSMCLFAGGCGGVEPEKRIYPLALGVDLDEKKNYVFTYGMPDMMRATGQDKAGEEGVGSLTVSGSSFSEIEQVYRRSQGKYLDLGHLQILVLGNSMLERENWRHLADYLRQELYVGENIYVFQAESGQRAVSWRSGTESSLGEWVQGIMENNQWDRRPGGITLRDIYYDFYTGKELQKLPVIRVEGEQIHVDFPGQNKQEKTGNT